MELWIRSQDREDLMQIKRVGIQDVVGDGANYIILDREYDYPLATYKTKERALEVLDEIQMIIGWLQKDMRNVTVGDINSLYGKFEDYVYEMPKE